MRKGKKKLTLGFFSSFPSGTGSPVVLASSWLSWAPASSLAHWPCCHLVRRPLAVALCGLTPWVPHSRTPIHPTSSCSWQLRGCWLSLASCSLSRCHCRCSTCNPPYEQWLGQVLSRSPSSPHCCCWCRRGGRPSLSACLVLSPSFPCPLVLVIPVVPSCLCRSAHHAPVIHPASSGSQARGRCWLFCWLVIVGVPCRQ
jgi:hypothetical protein